MADLIFGCTGATAERYAATPTVTFALTITERTGVRVHAIALRCQIRIEPHRRRYSAAEAQRLHDLFGDPSRWAETVKPIQLATVTTMVPAFTAVTETDLPVATWRELVDAHFPGRAWLPCGRETLDALSAFKAKHALPTWDATLTALMAEATPADAGEPARDAGDPEDPAEARQP